MKILAIGDPHGHIDKIRKISMKGVDLILITGDLGSANLMRQMAFENIERKRKGLPEKENSPAKKKRAFMEAYTSSMRIIRYLARFAPVITIYGNVESTNVQTRKQSKELGFPLPFLTDDLKALPNVSVINNRLRNFDGVRIGGLDYFVDTNWVQDFKPSEYRNSIKAAKKSTEKARRILKKWGYVDILLHHQPPYGFLDKVTFASAPRHWRRKHAGSKVILQYLKTYQPRYSLCGHIHEGKGRKRIGNTLVYNLGVGGFQFLEM